MAKITKINHVTVVVNQLEEAAEFYENVLGLEVIPAFVFDYPTAFFRINADQQLHLTEWEDMPSFRGHVCMTVEDFSSFFWEAKALGIIDIHPWGKVRRLPDGAMQMFVRDPSGNLIEISSPPDYVPDQAIFEDELYQDGLYTSGRNDFRGYKSEKATLYHGRATHP
jgi:catechol 2,3-dioxygenase-like lactoylglutathione lyase family enzyme